jgi:hypothetical protein
VLGTLGFHFNTAEINEMQLPLSVLKGKSKSRSEGKMEKEKEDEERD